MRYKNEYAIEIYASKKTYALYKKLIYKKLKK